MYEVFIKTKIKPTCISKWCEKLNVTLSEEEWIYIFSLPFKISNDSGLQWFQYRINHRIIATNSLLLNMKLKNNELCSFCKNEIESLEHVLVLSDYKQFDIFCF
jgi:hypothetical protein